MESKCGEKVKGTASFVRKLYDVYFYTSICAQGARAANVSKHK